MEGHLKIGDEVSRFEPGAAYGTLDYGRGFWPSSAVWNWAAASARQGGHVVGLNLGRKWTDGTGMNEHGYVIDGHLTKIREDLVWAYDGQDLMRPWRIHAPATGLIDVRMEPRFERRSETGIPEQGYDREVSQVFGHIEGYVVAASGERMPISNLFGGAEELTAGW